MYEALAGLQTKETSIGLLIMPRHFCRKMTKYHHFGASEIYGGPKEFHLLFRRALREIKSESVAVAP